MNKKDVWSRTFSGGVFHPLDPRIDEVMIDDIVSPLAKSVRYNGGIRRGLHYSVAEHSVLITRLLRRGWPDNPALALQGLMHDAAEAYVGDMIRPVKQAIPQFAEIESRIAAVIFAAFRIPHPWPKIIDDYDARICLDEEKQALHPGERRFEIAGGPLGVRLQFWDAEEAREQFVIEFMELRTAAREQRLAKYEAAT
jgi:hypothetical protein